MPGERIDTLLRDLAPEVLALTARRHAGFDLCEDATQEALIAAATQWPASGVPENPKGWLVTVASRRWIELARADAARRRREALVATGDATGPPRTQARDDSLMLLFLCCHPALSQVSQVALTLRAVGGLTTAEIARALFVPESTVGQRISRAKAKIRASGASFTLPEEAERPARLGAVLRVLYLVFNEGYTASSGSALHRVELSAEAIRLTRRLHDALPAEGEVTGLLALMLLTDARRPARTTADGGLVPLADQDRRRWSRPAIEEGVRLLTGVLATATIGPYQLQAAIAAVHDEGPSAAETDWRQILGLYDVLVTVAPGPMVALNRIVALAMVHGARTGLEALHVAEPSLNGHHRIASVRAHLLALSGRYDEARQEFARAARSSLNRAERQYLERQARPG